MSVKLSDIVIGFVSWSYSIPRLEFLSNCPLIWQIYRISLLRISLHHYSGSNRIKNNILILIYFVLILSFVIFRSIRTIVFESDPELEPNCPLERH